MTKALGIYNVVKLQQIFISPGKICKKDIVRRYVNWGSSCWVGGEVLLKKTEQIICTSAKPRAAEELYFSMISPDRQAEGELYTWVTVSPKGSSSLTGWRTKGWTGRDEAEGAEEEGAWRRQGGPEVWCRGSQPRGGSADRVLLGFDGAMFVPRLTPQRTDRQTWAQLVT